ncbi:AMP-binding protein [Polaromonas hydrogenivorans]|uniref:AMP-binding protein n=1 Tax=Polaromonas hydrogenivorans TaxID=335476 RepID=A0AAU7M026_9BURK
MDYLNQIKPTDCFAHRLLETRALENPNDTFFTFEGESYTFAQCNQTANRLARNLLQAGIQAGTYVAVLMETSVEYLHLWMALSKLGAVSVPINTAYRGDILTHVLKTCQATVCVMDECFVGIVEEASAGFESFAQVYVRAPEGRALSAGAKHFETLYSPNDDSNLVVAQRHDDTAVIIFTSGTTGPSKGVILSHHYLTAYGLMYAEINGLKDDDVVMNFLPFFHIAAKFMTIGTLVSRGRMLLQKRLSISTFWQEVKAHRVTNFIGVGGICNMLISRPETADDSKTTIRTIYAVPDPADIHAELERRFGCQITTVFGSTEAGLPLFRGVGDAYRPKSCGRVSPYYEVQIVDADDNPVPVGTTGEIVVRPKRPFLTGSGYIGMPERTITAWRNLWLHTGDSGHMDEDGWFYFDDRVSDSIRRRGENISSFEVEVLVNKHPAVSEAVAVATPSEIGEDEVLVQVILREGHTLRPEDLLKHCCEQMPYFMVPRFIGIVNDFPRTATAKVEKYRIRAASRSAQIWDREEQGWKVTREGLFDPQGQAVGSFSAPCHGSALAAPSQKMAELVRD